MEDIVTQKELQKIIKKSSITIYRWKQKGLPTMIGNMFYMPDVIKWMSENSRAKKVKNG